MEEKVKDVYENIKDRLSNPLIFSFACSWLVYNWKIPVALLWYDKSQFSGCGCNTIFDFIEWYWINEGTFRIPFIIAVLYTIGIPFFKNGIRILSAYAQKWGENGEIKALDGGKIGIEKYLGLRDDYKKRIKDLEDVANEERKYLDENRSLILELNAEKEKLNQSIKNGIENNEFIDKLHDVNVLNGSWIYVSEKNKRGDFDLEIELNFNQDDIYQVLKYNKSELKYKINHFFYDLKKKKVFFIKELIHDKSIEIGFDNKYKINDLYFKDEKTLVGKENGFDIEYRKKIR